MTNIKNTILQKNLVSSKIINLYFLISCKKSIGHFCTKLNYNTDRIEFIANENNIYIAI